MRLRVTRNLNIRKFPDQISRRVGVVMAGTELDVDGSVAGESINGNALWYFDKNRNYYWSGGLESAPVRDAVVAPVTTPATTATVFVDYSDWIIRDNPELKKHLVDDPIRVAVLDSGVYEEHPDFLTAFDQLNFPSENCTTSQNTKDVIGHGTHVAGLIGARSDDRVGIIGTAPKCILRNIKVIDDAGRANGNAILAGLNKLSKDNVDIVNLSLDVTFANYKILSARLTEISKFAVIIAAAGNNAMVVTPGDILYPADSPDVISVGAINAAFFSSNPKPVFNKRIDFLLPELSLTSSAPKEKMFYREDLGSSMATAIVSGMAARIMKISGTKDTNSIRVALSQIATPYNTSLNTNSLTLIKPS